LQVKVQEGLGGQTSQGIVVVVVVDVVDVDEMDVVVVVVVVVLITWNVLHSNVALLVELTDTFHQPAVHVDDNEILYCFPVPLCIRNSPDFLDVAFLHILVVVARASDQPVMFIACG
jgi:hypothetical protein